MRKWVWIGLAFVLVLVAAVAIALGLAWWASRSVPAFYREAIENDPVRQAEASDQLLQTATTLTSDVHQEGRWEATFTTEQINGWLAVDLVKNHPDQLPPSIQKPRVMIEPEQLHLACRFQQGRIDSVLSLSLDAYLAEPNVLALRIHKARAGSLPLPLNQVMEKISETARRAGLGIRWRQAEGDPVALIALPEPDAEADSIVRIDTLQLGQGEIYVGGVTEPRAALAEEP